jgi:hypothetical protein
MEARLAHDAFRRTVSPQQRAFAENPHRGSDRIRGRTKTEGVRTMAKKMSKLKAFKGRSKGQQKRRKQEAVEAAVDKTLDGVTEIVRHGIRRFPRLKKG